MPELVDIAAKHDASPAAVPVAWAADHPAAVTIPKASSREHLEANLAVADLTLDAGDVARIDAIERRQGLFPE